MYSRNTIENDIQCNMDESISFIPYCSIYWFYLHLYLTEIDIFVLITRAWRTSRFMYVKRQYAIVPYVQLFRVTVGVHFLLYPLTLFIPCDNRDICSVDYPYSTFHMYLHVVSVCKLALRINVTELLLT
jgi:hypothetical protein